MTAVDIPTPRQWALVARLCNDPEYWTREDARAFVKLLQRGDLSAAYHLWWDQLVGQTVGLDYLTARDLELRLFDAAMAVRA